MTAVRSARSLTMGLLSSFVAPRLEIRNQTGDAGTILSRLAPIRHSHLFVEYLRFYAAINNRQFSVHNG